MGVLLSLLNGLAAVLLSNFLDIPNRSTATLETAQASARALHNQLQLAPLST